MYLSKQKKDGGILNLHIVLVAHAEKGVCNSYSLKQHLASEYHKQKKS